MKVATEESREVSDVVGFDPEAVLVNGVPVIVDGELQEIRPGWPVRRGE